RRVLLGSKTTCGQAQTMSALPPKADNDGRMLDVRFVPKADILHCGKERRYSITSSAAVSDAYGIASYRDSSPSSLHKKCCTGSYREDHFLRTCLRIVSRSLPQNICAATNNVGTPNAPRRNASSAAAARTRSVSGSSSVAQNKSAARPIFSANAIQTVSSIGP